MTASPGDMLSHYRLVEKIGAGGMGIVYRAHDSRLRRDVAIKVLSPDLLTDPRLVHRFRHEAQAAAAVTHSNIATIHEIDEDHGVTFIVMELVDGRPLRSLIAKGGLPLDEALRIAIELAEGLARAHEAHIIHRDLKPDNVLITRDHHVKILDFGLAKLLEDREAALRADASRAETETAEVTREGQLLGTPSYMSPEQARGDRADPRSDIFSFGITLYEMLTGRRPFSGNNRIETLAQILNTPHEPAVAINSRLPSGLTEILDRCLEKDPAARYRDAGELVAALHAFQEHRITPAPGPPTPARASKWLWTATIASFSLALILLLIVIIFRPAPAPDEHHSIALLPLRYQGPDDSAHLKNLVPLLIIERLRTSSELQVVPFDFSRAYDPESGLDIAARQLGVRQLIVGRLQVTDGDFDLLVRITSAGEGESLWSREMRGELATLFEDAEGLAAEILSALGVSGDPATLGGRQHNVEAMALYLQGKTLLEGWDVKKNYRRAAGAAQAAIDIEPRFAAAHALLSRALRTEYLQTKDPSLVQRAVEAAERAVKLEPTLPEAHAALGSVILWRGRSAEAALSFEEGLRLAPADDALTRHIARAYARLGRDPEAEEMYKRAIELRPSYWAHHNGLGVFYFRRGRLEEAKQAFREVIRLRPESDTGYANLAAAIVLAGEHAEAEPILRAALRIDPAPQTRNNLGVVYYATGRFEEAARVWQENVDAGAETVMFLSNLGDAYRQLGRADESRRAYRRAVALGSEQLDLDSQDAEARAMFAIALAGDQRCEESRRNADLAMQQNPGDPNLCYYAALAAAICEQREAAVQHTRCAIEGGIKADVVTNPDLEPLLDHPRLRELLD